MLPFDWLNMRRDNFQVDHFWKFSRQNFKMTDFMVFKVSFNFPVYSVTIEAFI